MNGRKLDEIRAEAAEAAQKASPPGISFPAVIDSTMRSDFITCPHKFYEAHILGLRGMESDVHLHFGGWFARGLEVLRKSFWSPLSPHYRNVSRSVAEGVKAILLAWGDFRIPNNVPPPAGNKTLEA